MPKNELLFFFWVKLILGVHLCTSKAKDLMSGGTNYKISTVLFPTSSISKAQFKNVSFKIQI